ncbi:MAG: polymerase subunit delta [Bacilli bacterium]|nr:polymerase subunit delta [Bacilli bacterium]
MAKQPNGLSPVYLLYGAEEFLLEEALHGITRHAACDDPMSVIRFESEDTQISQIVGEAMTFPFFSERKAIIMSDCLFLTAKGKADPAISELETYLDDPSPFTVLFLVVKSDKLDERKKVVKLLKQKAQVYVFPTLKEGESKQWVKSRAQQRGLQLEQAAIDRLLLSVGGDLRSLDSELEKLAMYLASDLTGQSSPSAGGNSQRVDESLVDLVASRTRQHTAFVFVDDVVRLKIDQALTSVRELQKAKESAVYLVFLLARQYRIVLQVKTKLQRGYSSGQIAEAAGIHPYVCKLAIEQAKAYEITTLEKILIQLTKIDHQLKTGQIHEQEAIIDFILWLSSSFDEMTPYRATYR